jgi:hypothetical protein
MKAELLAGVGKPDETPPPSDDVDPFANISPPRGGGARSAEEKRREAEEEKKMEAEAKALVKKREEALKAAAAEKEAMANVFDSVFEDKPAGKSKKAKGSKGELSGWRLKKELRKAQSEADDKGVPYDT